MKKVKNVIRYISVVEDEKKNHWNAETVNKYLNKQFKDGWVLFNTHFINKERGVEGAEAYGVLYVLVQE